MDGSVVYSNGFRRPNRKRPKAGKPGPGCAYWAVMPPSMTNSAPVIQAASSEAR